MSLRLVSPIPDHVMMGARAAIWAAAAAGKITASTGRISETDLDGELHDLATLLAHIRAGAVKVWSSAFFPAVIDSFPVPVDVVFTDGVTHPWKYFATTAPLQVYGPDFELIPRGEVPAEAVEAALRELSRPLAPGTIIGSTAVVHPPSPLQVRVARVILQRLRSEEISHLSPAVVDAIRTGKWIAIVGLLTEISDISIKEIMRYRGGVSVFLRGGSVDIFPIGGAKA